MQRPARRTVPLTADTQYGEPMTRALRVLVLMSLTVAAAACGTDSAETNEPASPDDLIGRTFVSTDVTGTPIPGDGPLTVEFPEPGRIAATAGCNRFVGSVDLADGSIAAPALASTMMACPPPRDGADQWLSTLFDAQPQWTLDGDVLVLTGAGTTVTLGDKKVVDPDRPVTGTEWTVTTLRTPDAVTSSLTLETAAPTLILADDGTVSGSTGCNRFSGPAEVGDGTITFGALATTLAACIDPETTEIERHILGVLAGETTYVVDGPTMTLTAEDGTNGLGLTAR